MKCEICGNESDNKVHIVRERMINKGESFRYLECGNCGAWYLIDEVEMSRYYQKGYNPYLKNNCYRSIGQRIKMFFLVRMIIFSNYNKFQFWYRYSNTDILIQRLCGIKKSKYSRFLDVGCASGHWLDMMYDVGYKNLTGVDLFVPDDRMKGKKWNFIKGDIFSVQGEKFDVITLHHSFEHMDHHIEVLKKIETLLKDKGVCIISIPLAGGEAHKMFQEDYCQLDAPRHIALFTLKAFELACKESGLQIKYINFDSHETIYSISSGYKNTNKNHDELMKIPSPQRYRKLSKQANRIGTADQAIFILKKYNIKE